MRKNHVKKHRVPVDATQHFIITNDINDRNLIKSGFGARSAIFNSPCISVCMHLCMFVHMCLCALFCATSSHFYEQKISALSIIASGSKSN